jgi:hypothetical protein
MAKTGDERVISLQVIMRIVPAHMRKVEKRNLLNSSSIPVAKRLPKWRVFWQPRGNLRRIKMYVAQNAYMVETLYLQAFYAYPLENEVVPASGIEPLTSGL